MTIGDGRFGLDSVRIREKGFRDVLPTDICPTLLEEGKKRGIISEYAVVNVESMDMKEGSVDNVFCKEAFHHFPRPIMALYNMLRVARKGVVLSEPNDCESKNVYVSYEPSGNFVYGVSKRELIKMAIAMNYPAVCYYGYSDCYIKGCEFELADEEKSDVFRKMLATIKEMDEKVEKGQAEYGKISIILFKELPSEEITKLKEMGCTYTALPHNPYLEDFVTKQEAYYVYGTGNTAKKVTDYLKEREIEILAYVDSNPNKWGTSYADKTVISPEQMIDAVYSEGKVIIASIYYSEIKNNLLEKGVLENNILIAPLGIPVEV